MLQKLTPTTINYEGDYMKEKELLDEEMAILLAFAILVILTFIVPASILYLFDIKTIDANRNINIEGVLWHFALTLPLLVYTVFFFFKHVIKIFMESAQEIKNDIKLSIPKIKITVKQLTIEIRNNPKFFLLGLLRRLCFVMLYGLFYLVLVKMKGEL